MLSCPLTIKIRKGYWDNDNVAHTFVHEVKSWGATAVTLHGRSRQQRYVPPVHALFNSCSIQVKAAFLVPGHNAKDAACLVS